MTTEEKREYLARKHPEWLSAFDRGEMGGWFDANESAISEWSRMNPEDPNRKWERERMAQLNRDMAGW